MSSVPETRFTLPIDPTGIFSRLWELFFGPTKSTNDTNETSSTENRMIASKKCKPWSRTRPSHGWECERESRMIRPFPNPSGSPPRKPRPWWAQLRALTSDNAEAPSMLNLHEVPDTEGPHRRPRPNRPVCPGIGNRNPLNDPYDPMWDDFPSVPGTSVVETVAGVIVIVACAVKDAIVWVVTHPNTPYVAGVMTVGAACYYAYKWWCPETAVSVTN